MKTKPQELTDEQLEVVSHFTGPALVLAGPGSGKTLVITKRVQHLIEKRNIKPQKILVTTFTEKAAAELKQRLFKNLNADAGRVQVSTIHSLCKTFLEGFFDHHAFGSQFMVLDADTQSLLIEANKSRLHLGGRRGWRDIIIAAAGYGGNPEDTVCSLYNFLTDNDIKVDELKVDISAAGKLTHDMERLLDSYTIYEEILCEEKKMDFSHLQTTVYKLLYENKEVCEKMQNRFEFILVDEYQDTSPMQDLIFRKLAEKHQNIFVVGDENQSIYAFRGANVDNFIRFPQHFKDTREYFLSTNFRSTEQLVKAANKIIEGKIKRELIACRKKGNEIIVIKGEHRQDAARQLIRYIQKLTSNKKINYGDVALLCRKKSLMEPYIYALREKEIPYTATDQSNFEQREEIKGYLNFFNYVTQNEELDEQFKEWSWWNVNIFINEVLGLSPYTIQVLENTKSDFDIADLTTEQDFKKAGIKNKNDIKKLTCLNKLRNDDRKCSLLDIFYTLFAISGYISQLFKDDSMGNQEKLFNIAQLTRIVDNYERTIKRPSAQRLLKHIYYRSKNNGYTQHNKETDNTVKVMTVHKAKGLEFPVVVICSLIAGDFPLRFREDFLICGVPINKKFCLNNTHTIDEEEHYNEELRLFYVALTRTQDLLLITESEKINTRKATQSRFRNLIKDYISQEINENIVVETEYSVPTTIPHISYTSMSTYLDCPFRYLINYVYDFISPPSYIQTHGIIVHNVLQKINNDIKNKKQVTKNIITEYYDMYEMPLFESKKEKLAFKQKIIENSWNYYNMALREWKEIVSIEHPFTYIDENIIVNGKTDLIAVDRSHSTVLVDFKARTIKGIETTMVENQLNFYTYCLKDKKIDKMMAYTVLDNKRMEFDYDEKKIKDAVAYISEGLRKGNYYRNRQSPFCISGRCSYKFICEEMENE